MRQRGRGGEEGKRERERERERGAERRGEEHKVWFNVYTTVHAHPFDCHLASCMLTKQHVKINSIYTISGSPLVLHGMPTLINVHGHSE